MIHFAVRAAILVLFGAILPLMAFAADYGTRLDEEEGIQTVHLSDSQHHVEVTVVPTIGNMAVSMKCKGHEILYMPTRSLAALQANPKLGGVPFLAPWANRIDGMSYWANGKRYLLNPDLGTLRLDPNHLPIHGLLSSSPLWKIVERKSDSSAAWVTSRLEFSSQPDLLAQFPFAHTIEMTYRLHDGILDVQTVLHNRSDAPLPVAIGFHPYFQLDDVPRDEWTAHIAAREHLILNDKLTPTGETKPMDLPDPFPLKGGKLDDGFISLIRDNSGHADFWVQGKRQRITVSYGPKFTVAVAFAPPGQNFICFEPMAAVTNAFNLAHEHKWKGLQSIPPGGEWRETFQIRPSGF